MEAWQIGVNCSSRLPEIARMRMYLGGYLDFYHPERRHWLEVAVDEPVLLRDLLTKLGIPPAEVQLAIVSGQLVDLHLAIVSGQDEVKLFSGVDGG